jgi:hypothetical protein
MTFESHANTVLAHVEDLPESFEPTWMPGWSATSYIKGKCPHVKEKYWSRYQDNYTYLYRLKDKYLIQARKSDGFWFYSKESIDQLEELLKIRETLSTDDLARWYEERKPLNTALQLSWSKRDQVRQDACDAMNQANEAMEQAKEMMNDAFKQQLQLSETLKAIDRERRKVQKQIKKSEKELEVLPDNREMVEKWINRPRVYNQLRSDPRIPDYRIIEDGTLQIHY